MKIREDCWLKNNCSHVDCEGFCIKNYKMNYLYNAALISNEQRKSIALVVDKDGKDLKAFTRLKEIQTNIANFVKDGGQLYIHSQGCGNGKAQPDYSKILTLSGFVHMKDIKEGDTLFGEDGKPHKVIKKFDRGIKKVYRLTFSDRTSADSCDEHIWRIKESGKEFKNVELSSILGKNLKRKSGWRFQIPISQPLQYPSKKTLLSPYLLGCLIGDGSLSKHSLMFTNTDSDVIERVRSLLPEGCSLHPITKKDFTISCSRCSLRALDRNPVKEALREYKLLGRTSYDKFIPHEYLFNDYESRVELLKGLMDTDGTIAKKNYNNISFSTTSKQLSDDFKFLCQTLGGTCTVKFVEDSFYKDKKGIKRKGSSFYRCQIKLPKGLNPFFCRRKRERFLSSTQNEPYRTIRDITFVGERHCYCIMTDNPSGLYLTDDCVVTHNTSWALRLAQAYIESIWTTSKLSCRVLFINTPKLLIALKDNITEKSEYANYIKENVLKADLVIWDDIATASTTKFESENLFSMVDPRISLGKANIYTSNLNRDELHLALGDRLTSRICTASVDIEFFGKDKRGLKNDFKD